MKKLLLTTLILLFTIALQAQVKLVPARLYGAIPNDGHDDTPVFKYLIRKVSAMPNYYILLEPGKYDTKRLRIDYEILQTAGRLEDTTPTPQGYEKMFFIFLIAKKDTANVALNTKH